MRLYISLFTFVIMLVGCSNNSNQDATTDSESAADQSKSPSSENTVYVYNWSDYVAEDTIARFEKATEIKVVYDVYSDNETLDGKLSLGSSGYDVVFPSARPFAQRQIESGIYLKLDKNKLPNWRHLNTEVLKSMEDVDSDNAHLMPYMWGTTGIGYNINKVKEVLGTDSALDTWGLLFDPASAEKLAQCGIGILDDEQEGFSAALIYKGKDPNGVSSGEIEIVKQTYAAIKPHIRYFDSSRYINDLANGEICIAMGYNGDVLQARDRAAEANKGIEIGYIIPKEGAIRWLDVAAIPKDAPHPEAAHAFLNFLMQPDVIAPVTNFVGYANANKSATELVDESVRNNPGIYPSAEVESTLVDPKLLPDTDADARLRAWNSIKTGS